MSCCDDEIIIETTVDEIIITEGSASGVSATEVADAIQASQDAERQRVTYNTSHTDEAAGIYGTWATAHAAADAIENVHTYAEIEMVDDGFAATITAGAWEMGAIVPRGVRASGSNSTFVTVADGATLEGLQLVYGTFLFSVSTAHIITMTQGQILDFRDFGGIANSGGVPAILVPAGVGATIRLSDADGIGGPEPVVQVEGRLTLEISGDMVSTINRDQIVGVGGAAELIYYRELGVIESGSFSGFASITDTSFRDTDDLPEGVGNLYHTDARVDARIEAAEQASWHTLATQWSAEPALSAAIAAGDVWAYSYDNGAGGTTTRYRLVPSPYDATADAFYTGFDGTTLTGPVAARAMEVSP